MQVNIKKTLILLKKSQLSNFKRKLKITFKLFEFLERFMIGAFFITINQLEKNGPTGKVFIPLEI